MDFINNLILSLVAIAGSERVILTDILPLFEFKDGQRTEKQIGWNYLIVAPDARPKYLAFSVKVLKVGKPVISKDELEQSTEPILITFENFKGRMYKGRDGEYHLSASADDAEVLLG